MGQQRWTYYDASYGTQVIGLYHGEESGHVVVYLNSNVVIIDFSVLRSKTYTIIVNEKPIKVCIEKVGEEYEYSVERISDIHRRPKSTSYLESMRGWFS